MLKRLDIQMLGKSSAVSVNHLNWVNHIANLMNLHPPQVFFEISPFYFLFWAFEILIPLLSMNSIKM
jgi:hypothetical protein